MFHEVSISAIYEVSYHLIGKNLCCQFLKTACIVIEMTLNYLTSSFCPQIKTFNVVTNSFHPTFSGYVFSSAHSNVIVLKLLTRQFAIFFFIKVDVVCSKLIIALARTTSFLCKCKFRWFTRLTIYRFIELHCYSIYLPLFLKKPIDCDW